MSKNEKPDILVLRESYNKRHTRLRSAEMKLEDGKAMKLNQWAKLDFTHFMAEINSAFICYEEQTAK